MDAPQPPQQPGPWGEPSQWPAAQATGDVPERPQSLSLAVRLMQVGAALSLLGILFTFTQRSAIEDTIEDDYPEYTAQEVDDAATGAQVFGAALGIVAAGLWLWMAYANGRGKSWARIVASVLGGLNVLSVLAGFAMGGGTGLSVLTSLVSLALAVTILVLLYRPDSSRYYDVMAGRTGY